MGEVMYYSEPFSECKGAIEPLGDLASCRYCLICGVAIFPDKLDQHTNYHLTILRILNQLAEKLSDAGQWVTPVWHDLENLKNGELT